MRKEKSLFNRALHVLCLSAVLALVTVNAASQSSSPCPEWDADLVLGSSQTLELARTMWVQTQVEEEHVYQLDVTGPDGTRVEIWEVEYDDFCTLVGVLTGTDIADGTASLVWIGRYAEAVAVIPAAKGSQRTVTLSLSELAAPPAAEVLVIPAAAHAPGAHGTFFQTDLWLLNASSDPEQVRLTLYPTGGGEPRGSTLSLNPWESRVLKDMVLTVFGFTNASGALTVTTDGSHPRLNVASRTYNTRESGTYGQFIGAQEWRLALGRLNQSHDGGPQRTLLGLMKSDAFRSNVGFAEVLGIETTVELELFDDSGTMIGARSIRIPAFSHVQLNDIFRAMGAPEQTDAFLTAEVSDYGRVFAYASIIDNRSSDQTYMPGLSYVDSAETLVIPAAASGNGARGTHWQTDLWVITAPDFEEFVEITFFPSDGSAPITATYSSDGSRVIAINDVVGQLGGSGSGALILNSYYRKIAATSRTYNTLETGTVGQFIPADAYYHRVATHQGVVGVSCCEDFRTNVGMFNPVENQAATVQLSLMSENGELIARDQLELPPLRHIQLNDIFSRLDAPLDTNCWISFEVVNRDSGIYAYASVIDNTSGDPVYIPGMRQSPPPLMATDSVAGNNRCQDPIN